METGPPRPPLSVAIILVLVALCGVGAMILVGARLWRPFFGPAELPIEAELRKVAKLTDVKTVEPGGLEGDATTTVRARFRTTADCQTFADAWGPKEDLIRDAQGRWSRDHPGRERRELLCDESELVYQLMLY